jgi:hypothetical protein
MDIMRRPSSCSVTTMEPSSAATAEPARPSAAGVSAATTSTVVSASVFVLIFNYFITALWRF